MQSAVERFSKYYEGFESRPIFETVNEMLNWSGLYNFTTRTLYEELIDARLSRLLIQELVTVRGLPFLVCTNLYKFISVAFSNHSFSFFLAVYGDLLLLGIGDCFSVFLI